MTTVMKPAGPSREEFSDRLLKGSVKKSYEPIVDIDWDAPLEPDKFFLPPRLVSLYGTPMWDEMTREQQIELSRQELVNTLSAGIWFENMLNQSLLRTILHEDPTSRSTHYKLTELGDETRHMVMFGKAIERIGAKPVRPRWVHRMVINALPLAFQRGSMLWVAALIGEEIFDSLQRQMMDDPELQPIIQRLMRIHVTEEARHIQFARDGARVAVNDMRTQVEDVPYETGTAEDLAQTVAQIQAAGAEALEIPADVRREQDVERMVAATLNRFGRIDVLVNNAGVYAGGPATELTEGQWDVVVDVDLKAPFLCSKHAARHMIARGGGGRIVTISSTSALVGIPDQVNYQSAKHGVVGQIRTLALELAPHGIGIRHESSEPERHHCHRQINRRGNIGRHGHVVHAQKIEARQQAAKHGAGNVPPVEKPQPRDSRPRGFD